MNNSIPGGLARTRIVLCVALSGLLAWILAGLVAAAMSRGLMFDGAMNLEVSRSLAEGHGPRRLYDFGDLFPHGVQTKEPYLLLGAFVFKVLGVGPVQAQLPNLIFVLALAGVIFWAFSRTLGAAIGLLAGVLTLSIPWMHQYALNGYGEIPTFVFGLSALTVVAVPARLSHNGLGWRIVVAGILAGLALATKTVALIIVGAVGLLILVRSITESVQRPLGDAVVAGLLYVVGILIPLTLVEAWRLSWLGVSEYSDWWSFQISRILYQAGVSGTSEGAQVGLGRKIAAHFASLSSELGIQKWHAATMIVLPIAGVTATVLRRGHPARWLAAGLMTILGCYLIWWLAITPTEKAWLRRIYIGWMCLSGLAAIALGGLVQRILAPHQPKRVIYGCLAALIIAAYVPFSTRALKQPISFEPEAGVTLTLEAADVVERLPNDALVFAYGWYAAPTLALQSGRSFIDLTDWPIGTVTGRETYLVADRATFVTGMLERTLARYPSSPLLSDNPHAQVFQLDFSHPRDPFGDEDREIAGRRIDFAAGKPLPAYGFEPFDATMGGSWAESDAEVLLRYSGERALILRAYMAPPSYFRLTEPLAGRLVIQGCGSHPFTFSETGWQSFRLPLHCAVVHGVPVRVRILTDNVFELPRLFDRQRAILVSEIGFTNE